MRLVLGFVHFLATPVFWALAVILRFNATHSQAMMAAMDMAPVTLKIAGYDLGPVVSDALTSMWLMYALMGLFHIGPWFSLFVRKPTPV